MDKTSRQLKLENKANNDNQFVSIFIFNIPMYRYLFLDKNDEKNIYITIGWLILKTCKNVHKYVSTKLKDEEKKKSKRSKFNLLQKRDRKCVRKIESTIWKKIVRVVNKEERKVKNVIIRDMELVD